MTVQNKPPIRQIDDTVAYKKYPCDYYDVFVTLWKNQLDSILLHTKKLYFPDISVTVNRDNIEIMLQYNMSFQLERYQDVTDAWLCAKKFIDTELAEIIHTYTDIKIKSVDKERVES